MPVVPFANPSAATRSKSPLPSPTPPAEPFALMAAAQMHSEGRLVEPHNIEEGPEYNKWDEALQAHGAIRLPKERDDPQKWMNQHNEMLKKQGIDREDRPDGSVILRKQVPSS